MQIMYNSEKATQNTAKQNRPGSVAFYDWTRAVL